MILKPLRGILVCEIIPQKNVKKDSIKLPKLQKNYTLALLKGFIDPESKEFVFTDYVKFRADMEEKRNYAAINKESFKILCELYLDGDYYESVYGVLEFPQETWLSEHSKIFLEREIMNALKGLEYV